MEYNTNYPHNYINLNELFNIHSWNNMDIKIMIITGCFRVHF